MPLKFISNAGKVKMYRLGIIEESLDDKCILEKIKMFFSQRLEEVPEDTCSLWHTNEYHVPDNGLKGLLTALEQHIKFKWYILHSMKITFM